MRVTSSDPENKTLTGWMDGWLADSLGTLLYLCGYVGKTVLLVPRLGVFAIIYRPYNN